MGRLYIAQERYIAVGVEGAPEGGAGEDVKEARAVIVKPEVA